MAAGREVDGTEDVVLVRVVQAVRGDDAGGWQERLQSRLRPDNALLQSAADVYRRR